MAKERKYHTHTLPSGKKYSHPMSRRHLSVKTIIKKIKERIVPEKYKKPVYRVTYGKSYYGIEEKKGTPKPFLTIYTWAFTKEPKQYSELSFSNETERTKHQLFIDWGTKAREHLEDSIESDEKYNLNDVGIDDIGELDGFEVHKVDKEEIVNELDTIHKSAVFYGRDGSLKQEYKF